MSAIAIAILVSLLAMTGLSLFTNQADPADRGDRVLVTGALGLITFLLAVILATYDVAGALWAFPAPTETWATIISGLAWPVVVLVVILRWSGDLSAATASIARRIRDGEGVKTPWLELPGAVPVDPGDMTRRDVRRLLNGQLTRATAAKWVKDNLPPGTDLLDFETSASYIKQREAMIAAVLA